MENILVVCRSNAGRSQIAQAFLKRYLRPSAVRSAGTGVRGEKKEGWLLKQDIVNGGLPYGLDISGNRRGQLRQDDLDWADYVIVVMPPDELEDLKSRPQAEGLKTDDIDAKRLADWVSQHEGEVAYWDVKDIRAGEAEQRTPKEVGETYAKIDKLTRDWIQKTQR